MRIFTVTVPTAVEAGIKYSEQSFEVLNASRLPVSKTESEKRMVRLAVGGEPCDARPISPELETQRGRYLEPTATHNACLEWKPPFAALAPEVPSLDDFMARDVMRSLAEEAQKNLAKALQDARTRSKPWLSEGISTENLAWFMPIVSEEGELSALIALEARFDIVASTLREAYRSPKCQTALRRPTIVRRAWGLTGLMWALFIDRLEAGLGFNFCKRCGRLNDGPANRDYCSKEQNPACRREYERERKRAARRPKR